MICSFNAAELSPVKDARVGIWQPAVSLASVG